MANRTRSAGDRLLDSLAENYEQRLAQLQNVIQDLTDRLDTSSQESVASSGQSCTDMPLSQCSSNENLATELSQFSPPRFTSNEDLSTKQDSTSKEEASAAPSSDESANDKVKSNGLNTIPLVPSFCDETELLLEVEHLRAQVDNLACQKLTLEANLEESQSYCEHLTILLGRYISNQHLLQTLVDEEQRLLAATDQLVAVIRLEKQEVMTNARLSAPPGAIAQPPSRERQQAARLKVALDRLQEEKRIMAREVAKLVCSDEKMQLGALPPSQQEPVGGASSEAPTLAAGGDRHAGGSNNSISNGDSTSRMHNQCWTSKPTTNTTTLPPSGQPKDGSINVRRGSASAVKLNSCDNSSKLICDQPESAPCTLAFEEAESALINFVHNLRAKCNTLRLALPNIDVEFLPGMTPSRGYNENGTTADKENPHCQNLLENGLQSLEALVNAQELLQLREEVASLKLGGHLQARESRFFQSELSAKEAMVDTLQEQNELLSRECQRLELALQRAASCHEPPVHSGCGEALSCPATENRVRRERFLKRRLDNLAEVSENLSKQCAAYRQLIRQLQRDNVSLLRRYERAKRKKMRPDEEDVVGVTVNETDSSPIC